jgi:hypothetical protein
VDFDGTVVRQGDHAYDDLEAPLVFMAGAPQALASLRRAGHNLILWSARSSLWLLVDPRLDPLVRAGVRPANMKQWRKSLPVNRARYQQMLDFVARELPGIFDAIDDGRGGKPHCDAFLDDRAFRMGEDDMDGERSWGDIAATYGEAQPTARSGDLGNAPMSALVLIPEGRLAAAIKVVSNELSDLGIRFTPGWYLGDEDFWTTNKATSVNVPWFLANDETWEMAERVRGRSYTQEQVERLLRHEAGHACLYAYELWKRRDWRKAFGDFDEPYMERYAADPHNDEFVEYLTSAEVPPHYGQKHPDEDWAETFAAVVDSTRLGSWRRAWGPVAERKVELVTTLINLMDRPPKNRETGERSAYRNLAGTAGGRLRGKPGL